MALTDEAKKQAMDAVSHRETTAMIRSYRDSGIEASPDSLFKQVHIPEKDVTPIPEDVKRKALDAVSNRETLSQIRLVRDNGEVTVPITPHRNTPRFAEKAVEPNRHSQTEPTREIINHSNYWRDCG